MIKTLIVDDEVWVCRLIENLVDWREMGFELVGTADNGQLAYDMIVERQPELVITDIRMPGFSGLELIEKIKTVFPETLFVVISGYSDFSYARQALENGVFSYLLKPIDRTELGNMLVRVRKNLEMRADRELENNLVKDRLRQSLVHLKEEYFKKLLFRETVPDKTPEGIMPGI